MPGPYILSDLRWHDGPLFVRYGSFNSAWIRDERGQHIPALRDPSGQLVEDKRSASFTPPPWVEIPDFLAEQRASLSAAEPPEDFGYRIVRSLHYSNAGGVYEAFGPAGEHVVLKEGRPYAGLTPDGRDAAARIQDEEQHLRRVAGPDVVTVRGNRVVHGHQFLALDYIDGAPLYTEVALRNPSVRHHSTALEYEAYRDWALVIAQRLTVAVERLHDSGLVHGDLHPRNVIVRPDGRVVLLDFEMARPLSDDRRAVVGAPGFVPPDDRRGAAADRYALACMKIALFTPLTALLPLDGRKADELLEHIRQTFTLDRAWLQGVRDDLALPPAAPRALTDDWHVTTRESVRRLQTGITDALAEAAEYSRTDRLWPGDPQQFSESGVGLAHGAAGVIHAIAAAGNEAPAHSLSWLDAAARRPNPRTGITPTGLFDGLAGLAWLHRCHGRRDVADRLTDQLSLVDPASLGHDLYSGLPGLGLHFLEESSARPELLDLAEEIASRLRIHQESRPQARASRTSHVARTGHVGLMWGATGTALFALRLYERTGDDAHLRLAIASLDHDLAHCVTAADGSIQVNEGWRLNPYLASGSTGIGLVVAQLLPHMPDPERYKIALDGIVAAASASFIIESGLFYGRAGILHFLIALARMGRSSAEIDEVLTHHADQLRLHALRRGVGIDLPGRGLMRISCDLATGSAGVLTALSAYSLLTFDPDAAGWDDLLPHLLPRTQSHARRVGAAATEQLIGGESLGFPLESSNA